MSRQKKLIALMWVGAGIAAVAVWASRRGADAIEEPRGAPGSPVIVSDDPPDSNPELPPANGEAPSPTQYRGDARHSGQSPFLGPSEGSLAWRFETEGIVSAQVVADERGFLYVGSHDHFFYALGNGGRERWKRDLGDRIYSTAAIDGEGNVYVGSDADAVWSFRRNGDQRWRVDVDGDADTGIALGEDGVVFGAGQALWFVEFDGTVRWRNGLGGKIFATPSIDAEGNIYVGCQDDHMYSFTPAGEQRWVYRTNDDNDGSPMLDDEGNIYFGSDDHHVYALNTRGEVKWSVDLDGMVRAPMALGRDGSLLVGVFGPRPRLVSLDRETGETRWFFPVTVADTTEIGVASGPIVDAGGNIYFGAHDDYVYALAPTGELRWAFATEGDVDASPVLLSTGQLVVGSDDHHVYAIAPR